MGCTVDNVAKMDDPAYTNAKVMLLGDGLRLLWLWCGRVHCYDLERAPCCYQHGCCTPMLKPYLPCCCLLLSSFFLCILTHTCSSGSLSRQTSIRKVLFDV